MVLSIGGYGVTVVLQYRSDGARAAIFSSHSAFKDRDPPFVRKYCQDWSTEMLVLFETMVWNNAAVSAWSHQKWLDHSRFITMSTMCLRSIALF
jgi:hypothetical protein